MLKFSFLCCCISFTACISPTKYEFIDQGIYSQDLYEMGSNPLDRDIVYADWSGGNKRDMNMMMERDIGGDVQLMDMLVDKLVVDMPVDMSVDVPVDMQVIEMPVDMEMMVVNCQPNSDEVCDLRDNDCDDKIDEGDDCKSYLASHCEFTLVRSDVNLFLAPIYSEWITPLERWAGPVNSYTRTNRDQLFHSLSLNGIVNDGDTFEINFKCIDNDRNKANLINWMNRSCHIALGYKENYDRPFDLDVSTCGYNETSDSNAEPKCIKSKNSFNGETFSILRINRDFDKNSGLAINFYCQPDPNYPDYHTLVQDSIIVFLGYHLTIENSQQTLFERPQQSFQDCLSIITQDESVFVTDNAIDQHGYSCMGSKHGIWSGSKLKNHRDNLGVYSSHKDQLVIGLFPSNIPIPNQNQNEGEGSNSGNGGGN